MRYLKVDFGIRFKIADGFYKVKKDECNPTTRAYRMAAWNLLESAVEDLGCYNDPSEYEGIFEEVKQEKIR